MLLRSLNRILSKRLLYQTKYPEESMQDLAEHVVRMCTETSTDPIVLESAVIPAQQLMKRTPYADAERFARQTHQYFVPDEYTDGSGDEGFEDEPALRRFRQFRVRCTMPVRTYVLETGTCTVNFRYHDDLPSIKNWTLLMTFRSATPAVDLLFRLATTHTTAHPHVFLCVGGDQWVTFSHDDRVSITELMKNVMSV